MRSRHIRREAVLAEVVVAEAVQLTRCCQRERVVLSGSDDRRRPACLRQRDRQRRGIGGAVVGVAELALVVLTPREQLICRRDREREERPDRQQPPAACRPWQVHQAGRRVRVRRAVVRRVPEFAVEVGPEGIDLPGARPGRPGSRRHRRGCQQRCRDQPHAANACPGPHADGLSDREGPVKACSSAEGGVDHPGAGATLPGCPGKAIHHHQATTCRPQSLPQCLRHQHQSRRTLARPTGRATRRNRRTPLPRRTAAHGRPSSTLAVYAHLMDDDLGEALELNSLNKLNALTARREG